MVASRKRESEDRKSKKVKYTQPEMRGRDPWR